MAGQVQGIAANLSRPTESVIVDMNEITKLPVASGQSASLFAEARRGIPAGVNGTARATWSGWDPYPLFVSHGSGPRITDVDGNTYVDYLLGHRPPQVTQAVVDVIQNRGTVFALLTADEALLADKIIAAIPSIDQVRLCNTGIEAVLYAVRLARAFTGRKKIIRFEGMYHGFSDGVCWSKHPDPAKAGAERAPSAVPQGPGMPAGIERSLLILPWNDAAALREAFERDGADIATVLTEPMMCNTGCILPRPGYLEAMRELTRRHGALLIFDEVITGFRIGLAGAQGHFGIVPDLSVFAKGLGGGFPVAAMGGRRDVMALVAEGRVSMAGTYSANAIAVAAANATLELLMQPRFHTRLYAVSDRLREGLERLVTDLRSPAHVVGLGSVLQLWFSKAPIHGYRDAVRHADHAPFRRWWEGMLGRGVLFHPHPYENLFASAAHTEQEVDETLAAARTTLAAMMAA